MNCRNKILLVAVVLFSLYKSDAQLLLNTTRPGNDLLYNKLSGSYLSYAYIKNNVRSISLPTRKTDPPFLVNELTPYRQGYIVNAISIAPDEDTLSIDPRFYFLSKDTIGLIGLPELDTIHSIITHDGFLYASGLVKGQVKVFRYDSERTLELELPLRRFGGKSFARWSKLASIDNKLYVLCNNGLMVYANAEWTTFKGSSMDDYFDSQGFGNSLSVLPTENIRIANNKLYFLQEITQKRTSILFEIELTNPVRIEEFSSKNFLTDNIEKEVDSYLTFSDTALMVAMNRTMYNSMVLIEQPAGISSIILNGSLNNEVNGNTLLNISCMMPQEEGILMLSSDGIFMLHNKEMEQIASFENSRQQIKLRKDLFTYQFKPRCALKLTDDRFLIGGMWGGLLMTDMKSGKCNWIDESFIRTYTTIKKGVLKNTKMISSSKHGDSIVPLY